MGSKRVRALLAGLAMLVALFVAAPASASTVRSTCHAFSEVETTYAELAQMPQRWHCHALHWKSAEPVSWLRFDASEWRDSGPPKSLVTRITKFDRLSISTVRKDGTIETIGLTPEAATPLAGGSIFTAPLPEVTDDTAAVVVRIVRPWNAAISSDAKLSSEPGGEGWPIERLVLAAMLIGLLIAPLIYDLAFYTVLRQRFVLWHAALVLMMMAYVLCFTGLLILFTDFSIVTYAKLNGITISIAVALAGFFAADFLEPYALSRNMRRALQAGGLIALLGPGVITLHPPFLDYTSHQFFFLGFIPMLVVLALSFVQALRRGSRSVKFQIAAWTPIMISGLEHIVRGVGTYAAPEWADDALYVALVAEVVISAIGVADRMMSLRHQRDSARSQARMAENLAEQDPLTGLLNRRAIEPRFTELCKAGFTTFALIDLDHFKAVNDQHGHDVGDEVLRAVADALAPDDDTLAMRLGGEEFLLLLRGGSARVRAEQRRQMLPRHIATHVPGLDGLVTASMGLVEGPPETMAESEFRDVYSRADKLLYEAKQAGRNRTISEKLTLFSPRGTDRRKNDRRGGDRRKDDTRKTA